MHKKSADQNGLAQRELRRFLESMGFGWRGFRKKQRKVRLRLYERAAELRLANLEAYRRVVATDGVERRRLHELLGITVSRFFRDRVDWERLQERVLERWIAEGVPRRAWSLGCASGEEPYSLRMLWLARTSGEDPGLEILATEIRPELLDRARIARYPRAALGNIPIGIAQRYVEVEAESVLLDALIVAGVRFQRHDYLLDPWPTGFDLVLARNGPFTYRAPEECPELLARFAGVLRPGGFLFLGSNDRIAPDETARFNRVTSRLWQLRR